MNKTKEYLKKHCIIYLFLSVTLIISCTLGDSSPPAQITDFRISNNNKLFTWTAPGDDANSGRANLYLLRFFTEAQLANLLGLDTQSLDGIPERMERIDEAFRNNFDGATHIQRFLIPQEAGSTEITSIPRLDPTGETKYFYSIVANDESGGSSPPSNVVEVTSGLVNADFIGENGGCLGESTSSGEFIRNSEEDPEDINRDLIIGDPCLGKVYIFIGGTNIIGDTNSINVNSADVTIIGNADDKFGYSVSNIGNISGSAFYEEFAIGAPEALSDTGQVFILGGGISLPSTIDLTSNPDQAAFVITGESSGDRFGSRIARHGSNAFLVSAVGVSNNRGRVYRFIGSNLQRQTSAANADNTITGREDGEEFGYSIANGGNINSASPNEFVVGAPGGGRAYIFFNTATYDLANDDTENVLTILGEDRFGEAVGGGFDIDGIEQNTDIVISDPSAVSSTGSVFIYSDEILNEAIESDGMTLSSADYTLRVDGMSTGDEFGKGLLVIRDINPSLGTNQGGTANVLTTTTGNADIVVGAPGVSGNGETYVFWGADYTTVPTILSAGDADINIPPNQGQGIGSFGRTINSFSDVNNDGFLDFTISGSNSLTLSY